MKLGGYERERRGKRKKSYTKVLLRFEEEEEYTPERKQIYKDCKRRNW